MISNRRKSRFIDGSLQGALIWRAVLHWTFLIVATLSILMLWQFLIGEPHQTLRGTFARTWERFAPCFVILLVVFPVVVRDSVRFSNRLAGPLYRLRGGLKNLAENGPARPIRLRKGDFCQDLASYFNAVLDRIERAERETGEPAMAPESSEREYVGTSA